MDIFMNWVFLPILFLLTSACFLAIACQIWMCFRAQTSFDWTDFNTVYDMRLVEASRAEYNGYKFLVIHSSPTFWTLKITKDGYEKLNDCTAACTMIGAKCRALEAIDAIEFMEKKQCPEK